MSVGDPGKSDLGGSGDYLYKRTLAVGGRITIYLVLSFHHIQVTKYFLFSQNESETGRTVVIPPTLIVLWTE